MSTMSYKCPCCGASLVYGDVSGKMECASCGNSYDLETVEAMQASDAVSGVKFDMSTESYGEADSQDMQAYTCESCGAALVTEGTTTATECPYCGSPTILQDRIEGGAKPEKVIPFTISKEQAQQMFNDYFKGKFLLPKVFKNTRNRISEIRKLYVPFWLFDCDADASIVFRGEKSFSHRSGDYKITYTDHYALSREGSMAFANIPVDGSVKLDNKISESLEPYDLNGAVPFQPAVLAGSMADHADVDAQVCEKRAEERVVNGITEKLKTTISGYSNVHVQSRNVTAESGKITPMLLPVWLITTEKEGKTYTFAINGQTGKLTCDVPFNKVRAYGVGGLIFAVLSGLAFWGIYHTDYWNEPIILLWVVVIAALIAYCSMLPFVRQLKRAASQDSAISYEKAGSFHLRAQSERFLYRSTRRVRVRNSNRK